MPKIVDHRERRHDILRRSQHLFAQRGYAALSMREIARQLGVTTGSLYHYFPNKRTMLDALFIFSRQRDIAQATMTNKPDDDFETRIRNLCNFIIRWEESLCQMIQIAQEYRRVFPDEKSHSLVRDTMVIYRTALVKWLYLPNDEVGDFVLDFLFGVLLRRLLTPKSFDLESYLQPLIEQMTFLLSPYTKTN